MSAAKFVLLSLLAVSSATVTRSGTSANVQPSAAQQEGEARLLAVAQHGYQPWPRNPIFTDERPAPRATAHPSEKWLVVLLFAALAAYQLGRNQRSVSHRLSSY
jgi:hypothetical protein